MRPLHLQLAASVLLVLCVLLVLRLSSRTGSGTDDPAPALAAARSRHHAAKSSIPAVPHTAEPTAPGSQKAVAAPVSRPSPVTPDPLTSTPGPTADSSGQGRAIQLADNVQLPGALMPDDEAATTSPEINAAIRSIGDTFYQTIAATPAATSSPAGESASPIATAGQSATADQSAPGGGVADPTSGARDDTTVIAPGPDVERARDIADETYRAMFGNDAYNRQTLNSTIEVNLPMATGSGQN